MGVAVYKQPSALNGAETQSEESCPYKTYHVSSNPGGGFEFRIERDSEACKEHYQAASNPENGPRKPRTVAETDLLAQKQMAYWTAWIGGFTAVGLAVLYITFHATREAVIETRKIGQAQTRCYPAITKATLRFRDGQHATHIFSDISPDLIEFKGRQYPVLAWSVENYGQTPAYDFAIWPTVRYKIFGEPAKSARTSPSRGPFPGDGFTLQPKTPAHTSGMVPFTLSEDELRATDSPLHPLEVYVLFWLRYIDAFDEVIEPKLAFYGVVNSGNFGGEIALQSIALQTFEWGMESAVAVRYPEQG